MRPYMRSAHEFEEFLGANSPCSASWQRHQARISTSPLQPPPLSSFLNDLENLERLNVLRIRLLIALRICNFQVLVLFCLGPVSVARKGNLLEMQGGRRGSNQSKSTTNMVE